jgi:hypothetical protein
MIDARWLSETRRRISIVRVVTPLTDVNAGQS